MRACRTTEGTWHRSCRCQGHATIPARAARFVYAMSLFELRPAHARPASGTVRPAAGAIAAIGQGRSGDGTTWWILVGIAALAACGLAVVVGTVVVSGDGVWHLIWGRELAEGTLGSFATGPTPHPSLLVLGAATSVLGDDTSYLVTYLLFGPLAFGVLIAAVFDVARRLSSHWAGAAAVLILATSVGLVSIAERRPVRRRLRGARRHGGLSGDGAAPSVRAACVPRRRRSRPARGLVPRGRLLAMGCAPAVLAGASGDSGARRGRPCVWVTMDLLVMGDPLYSFHLTDTASEVLYGQYTPWENLEAAGRNLVWYLGVVPLLFIAPAVVLLVRDRMRGGAAAAGRAGGHNGLFLLLLLRGMASSERYLLVPICVLAILAAITVDGGGRRTPRRVMLGSIPRGDPLPPAGDPRGRVRHGRERLGDRARETTRAPAHSSACRAWANALRRCPQVSLPTGKMRHWFAFYSGRPPESFVSDGEGITHPDLYIAPGNPAVAKMALTRPRFDDDASYTIPPGLRPGPRNADWVLYVAPASGCTRGLR